MSLFCSKLSSRSHLTQNKMHSKGVTCLSGCSCSRPCYFFLYILLLFPYCSPVTLASLWVFNTLEILHLSVPLLRMLFSQIFLWLDFSLLSDLNLKFHHQTPSLVLYKKQQSLKIPITITSPFFLPTTYHLVDVIYLPLYLYLASHLSVSIHQSIMPRTFSTLFIVV